MKMEISPQKCVRTETSKRGHQNKGLNLNGGGRTRSRRTYSWYRGCQERQWLREIACPLSAMAWWWEVSHWIPLLWHHAMWPRKGEVVKSVAFVGVLAVTTPKQIQEETQMYTPKKRKGLRFFKAKRGYLRGLTWVVLKKLQLSKAILTYIWLCIIGC